MKRDNNDNVEIQADAIYIVSVLLAQVVIWLLVSLLVYSEFALWKMPPSQNLFKMIIVAIIVVSLVGLSIFLFKRGKKRISDVKEKREQ